MIPRQIQALVFIALICFPLIAAAQRRIQTGQSTITGRVLLADNNRPVRRASVSLYSNINHPPMRTTPANHRGEFRFTEVAAGSYFVVANAPGIVTPLSGFAITEFGYSSNLEEQTRVTVDGKNTVRFELRVVRAGTIKGTITYADKEPVVNGRLVLFRRKGGTVTPFFADNAFTNDRGMYRIDGLAEGEYFVGVVMGRMTASGSDFRGPAIMPSGYYPGVRSFAEAKPVLIQSGAEVTGIDITLAGDLSRRISGVLKWRSGEPVTSGAVTVRRKNDPIVDVSLRHLFHNLTPPDIDDDDTLWRDMSLLMMTFPQTADLTPDGKWQFEDLAPATYILTAYSSPGSKKGSAKTDEQLEPGVPPSDTMALEQRMVSRQVEITIENEDRNDVTIELSDGGRVLGVVTMTDGSSPPQVPISVQEPNRIDSLLNMPTPSNPDGTFLLEAISTGDVWLDVDLGREDLFIKSITLGGQDLMREPLRVNDGAEVTGVRITLEKGLANLAGRVQWKEDGSPAAGAGVLLVKADPKLWHLRSSRCFASADPTGAFESKCAPGDYLAFTWPAGGQPLETIGDFLRAHAATARRILLQSKEEKQIEFTLSRPRK